MAPSSAGVSDRWCRYGAVGKVTGGAGVVIAVPGTVVETALFGTVVETDGGADGAFPVDDDA